jgi:hypothetical protein
MNERCSKWLALAICCPLILPSVTVASTLDWEFLGQNSRGAIDIASRVSTNLDTQEYAFLNVVGIDIHKVFSSDTTDIGTLTLQPYLVKLNNVKNPPFIFDDGDDTKLTWRITNFNFTALNQGKFNIRLGHFEVPFGLEYQIDTNGTLRQLTSAQRGIKTDWGFSINGILPQFEYEVALTRGSGIEFTRKDDPHLFSGRIGSLSNKNTVVGLSWLTGDVLGPNGTIEQKHMGLDASYYYYQWQFMAESSLGKVDENNAVNGFVEALWRNAKEDIAVYTQVEYQRAEIDHKTSSKSDSTSYWTAGVQWLSDGGFDISAQYKQTIQEAEKVNIDPSLSLQLRYRM